MGKEVILEFDLVRNRKAARIKPWVARIDLDTGELEFCKIVSGNIYRGERLLYTNNYYIEASDWSSHKNPRYGWTLFYVDENGERKNIASISNVEGRTEVESYVDDPDFNETKIKLLYARHEKAIDTLIELARLHAKKYHPELLEAREDIEDENEKKRNYWVNGSLVMIKTDVIYVPEWSRETQREYLEESIRSREIIVPLIVGRIKRPEGPLYILIDGRGRLELAKRLGIKEVPARLVDINDESEALLLSLELEETKKPWSLQYTLNVLKRLLDMGLSKQEIAEKLKISKSTLYRLLWLLEFPDDIKNLFISGALGLRNADIIHKALEIGIDERVIKKYFKEYENVNEAIAGLNELIEALKELKNRYPEYEFKFGKDLDVEIYRDDKKIGTTLTSVLYSNKKEIIQEVIQVIEGEDIPIDEAIKRDDVKIPKEHLQALKQVSLDGYEVLIDADTKEDLIIYDRDGFEVERIHREDIEKMTPQQLVEKITTIVEKDKKEQEEVEEEFWTTNEEQDKEIKQALRQVFPKGSKVRINAAWAHVTIKDKDTGMPIVDKRITKDDYTEITMGDAEAWVKKNMQPLILHFSRIISILKTLGYDTKPLEDFFNHYFASS